jgi:4-hydroxy-3-polyprenylbenzoate decarboxylase
MKRRFVIGITGASGAAYPIRVLHLMLQAGIEVHLAVTPLGRRLLADELNIKRLDQKSLLGDQPVDPANLIIHNDNDVGASIASGSFLHDGMVVVPCSSNTMGGIASGITQSLVQRAAMVCLKERRPLVLAHRESPLSRVDLENMLRLTDAGAVIAPLSPGFYMLPERVEDLVDFMAGKLLDILKIDHELKIRWKSAAVDD